MDWIRPSCALYICMHARCPALSRKSVVFSFGRQYWEGFEYGKYIFLPFGSHNEELSHVRLTEVGVVKAMRRKIFGLSSSMFSRNIVLIIISEIKRLSFNWRVAVDSLRY